MPELKRPLRLAIVDGEELVFVAKAQGAVRGLRYDPDMGLSVPLSCSAARYSCRMKGVGWGWAASKAFQARASIGPGESNTRMT